MLTHEQPSGLLPLSPQLGAPGGVQQSVAVDRAIISSAIGPKKTFEPRRRLLSCRSLGGRLL
jgi:hypothetical protein